MRHKTIKQYKHTIVIVYNKHKKNAKNVALNTSIYFKQYQYKVFINNSMLITPRKADFVLSIGGDGTMLKVIRSFAPLSVPVKGINIGALGFLADTNVDDIVQLLKDLLSSNFTIEKRNLLAIEFNLNNVKVKQIAVNDCIVKSLHANKLIIVNVKINNTFMNSYKCDGMIIATATGSTAYSLASTGPILYPTLPVFILTGISPHTLSQRSIVISDQNSISFIPKNKNECKKILISIDGQKNYILNNGEEINFSLYTTPFQLIKQHSCQSFFYTLRSKMHWGI